MTDKPKILRDAKKATLGAHVPHKSTTFLTLRQHTESKIKVFNKIRLHVRLKTQLENRQTLSSYPVKATNTGLLFPKIQ